MKLNNFIRDLQNQPYEKRVRYLWIGTIIAGAIVVVAWGSLAAINQKTDDSKIKENDKILQELQLDFEKAQDEFTKATEDLKKQFSKLEIPNEEGRQLLILDGTAISKDKTKLAIEFSIENPSLDVLKVFNDSKENAVLIDGAAKYSPELILTRETEDPYPPKILSKQNVSGFMVFPFPQNSIVTLNIDNMYFESIPNATFTETLVIDLNSEVKGTNTRPLPRQ